MPSPVVLHAVPVESMVAPRRPQAPPLPALKFITLCVGSSSLTAEIVSPAYVLAIQSTFPARLRLQPLPVWNMNDGWSVLARWRR